MDEILLRRLLGALVLFGGLFLLSSLLPDADAPDTELAGGKQRVQIELLPKPEAPPRRAAPPEQSKPRPKPEPGPATKSKAEPSAEAEAPPAASRPKSQPKPAAQPAPVPAGEQWWVQVASFSSQANAEALVKDLRGRGLKAVLETVQVGGRQVSRVLLGPYSNQQAAEGARSSIILSGFADARSFER